MQGHYQKQSHDKINGDSFQVENAGHPVPQAKVKFYVDGLQGPGHSVLTFQQAGRLTTPVMNRSCDKPAEEANRRAPLLVDPRSPDHVKHLLSIEYGPIILPN
jgi:hypothetical protein